MNIRVIILVAVFMAATNLLLGQDKVSREHYNQIELAYHSINANEIYDFVDYMSGDDLKGRLAGSPEYTQCAQWAANLFSSWGLLPGGDNGYYFQNFPIQYTNVKGIGKLNLSTPDKHYSFDVDRDYYPGIHTASGYYKGDVVYAGYSISAPEFNYDDYAGIDVKGKVALIDAGVPVNKSDKQYNDWFEKYSSTVSKVENAYKHGAKGVLILVKSPHPGIIHHNDFIYAHISDNVANVLLSQNNETIGSLRSKILATGKPASMAINNAQIEMEFASDHAPLSQTQNVIGYIAGSDPKLQDSPIIVGAHLDHLGAPGVVFPGALDNASGSAIVMSLAKALAQSGIKPLRPIVFILFGAEEPGMIGSKFYVKNPLFALDKTLCMFNLDMVGNGNSLRVSGAESFPKLKAIFVNNSSAKLNRILYTSIYEPAKGRMYTDGEIFNFNGVPAFSVGVRDKLGRTYYHVPEDRIETMTPRIMEDVAKLLFLSINDIACDKNFKLK